MWRDQQFKVDSEQRNLFLAIFIYSQSVLEEICCKEVAKDIWEISDLEIESYSHIHQSRILHHDNAPAHTLMLGRELLAQNKTVVMPQPLHPPDLARVDFFLFPKLKTPMEAKSFATIKEIKEKAKLELLAIPKSEFQKYFENWKKNAGISALYLRGVTLKW